MIFTTHHIGPRAWILVTNDQRILVRNPSHAERVELWKAENALGKKLDIQTFPTRKAARESAKCFNRYLLDNVHPASACMFLAVDEVIKG